jgi:CubicO group peptidase (beta-lactamase class C family)
VISRRALLLSALAVGACKRSAAGAPAPAIDVEPYRMRAAVPGIAWASVTRDGAITGGAGNAGADTPLEAASIAKTIVGTCVMQLAGEGRLALDEDVSHHVGFRVAHPKHPAPITLRMLLAHTSSIRDDFTRLEGHADQPLGTFLEGYLRGLVYLPDAPGTRMEYSNAGAALAALAVERAAKRPFSEVSRERVLAPLKMTSTSWRPRRAVYPAVDLRATAGDLARFARAILRGGELDGARILSAAEVEAMTTPAPPGEALGWQVRTFGRFHVEGHEGEDRMASTGMYVDRARGAGAVVLANGDAFASGDRARARAIGELVELLLEAAASRSSPRGVSS